MIKTLTRISAMFVAVVLAVAALGSPATAGGRGDADADDGGINAGAKAEIRINGDVTGGGTVSASSPALCWWEKSPIDTSSAAGIEALFQIFKGLGGLFGGDGDGFDFSVVKQMLEDQKEKGEPLEWYQRKASDSATEAQLEAAGCNDPSGPYQGIFVGQMLRPFEPGNPPDPLPDPRYMADVAMEHIDITAPELNWNPKAKTLAGGTLVNLPTWFWVNNPDSAVGDENGERSVTATAAAGGNRVSVTATAKASGVEIASAGGAASCSTDQARTKYAKGVSQAAACVLPFERASTAPAGFEVLSTVTWSVSWTGTGPGVPAGEQPLDGITQTSTTMVPVHESQAVVRGLS